MDKKNTLIGIAIFAVAAVIFILGPKTTPQTPAPVVNPSVPGSNQAPSPGASSLPATSPGDANFAAVAVDNGSSEVITLSNDFIEARFTNYGGAIKDIGLKKYTAEKGDPAPYVFNETHADPILAFATNDFTRGKLDRTVPYTLVSKSASEVVYRAVFENKVEITRRYAIVPTGAPKEAGDPYRIRHELTFRNLTEETQTLPSFALNIGTASPVNERDAGLYLNSGYYNDDTATFLERSKLSGGKGFLGMGASNPVPYIESLDKVVWASVSNQFFTGLLTPDQPGRAIVTRRIELPALRGMTTLAEGLTVNAVFDAPALPANGEATYGFLYYGGPKEYTRLSKFEKGEEKVMQYSSGWYRKIMLSGIISPAMNTLMNLMHSIVGQWGIAIILMTLLLKTITLPFTLAASRSAKRMQKVQPEVQAVREKYKDNPQKMNQAMMEVWKKHKINPMGGCLPILITMPLFVAFFFMLQSSAELRFQGFLWAGDLSAPDTLFRLNLGFMNLPINIMPLLMGATMLIQMNLTPSPSVDNAQARMMKMMPIVFTIICYNFSCALALYSTVNGLFTIVQQLVVNRMKDPAPVAATAAAAGNRGIKNVTPKKK